MNGEVADVRRDINTVLAPLKAVVAEEYDLPLDHPKFEKAFDIAWSYGHGSGYSDVESYFMELVELAK